MAVLDILGDGSCKALWEFDGSFNDKSGAYGGTPTNVGFTEGVHGQAALFKSSSNYVSTTLKTSDFGNTYSIACWFRRDSNNTRDCICGETGGTADSYGAYINHVPDSNELQCGHYRASLGNFDVVSVSTTVGAWTHLVFARQNGSFHRVYINGVRKGSVACSNVTASSSYSMRIGCDYYSTANRSFDGAIDTFRVFNKALTDEEVMAVYEERPPQRNVLPTPIILSAMPAALTRGFR